MVFDLSNFSACSIKLIFLKYLNFYWQFNLNTVYPDLWSEPLLTIEFYRYEKTYYIHSILSKFK